MSNSSFVLLLRPLRVETELVLWGLVEIWSLGFGISRLASLAVLSLNLVAPVAERHGVRLKAKGIRPFCQAQRFCKPCDSASFLQAKRFCTRFCLTSIPLRAILFSRST